MTSKTTYLAPNGRGDGGAALSAASMTDFPSDLGAGDAVVIVTPRGRETYFPWRKTLADLPMSGTVDAPASIRFATIGPDGDLDEAPAGYAVARHTRTEFPRQAEPDPSGLPFLVLQSPSHARITGPHFFGAGAKGFYQIAGTARDLAFSNIDARFAGRVIETADNSNISGLLVSNSRVYGAIRGFARFHHLSDAEFSDLDLDGAGVDGGGTRVCQMIAVTAGTNLRFRNVYMRRAANLINALERGSTFVQGDGIVLEEETSASLFDNCHARDMGDAGFDMKCDGITLTRCSTARCKYGVRIWRAQAENRITACHFADPKPRPRNAAACLWVGGRVLIDNSILKTAFDTAAIRFGKGPDTDQPQAVMTGGAIDVTEGAALLAGEPGQLILNNVRLNGTPTTGVMRWTGDRLVRG